MVFSWWRHHEHLRNIMSKRKDGVHTGNPRIHIRVDKEVYEKLIEESEKEKIGISEKTRELLIKAMKDLGLLRKDY